MIKLAVSLLAGGVLLVLSSHFTDSGESGFYQELERIVAATVAFLLGGLLALISAIKSRPRE